MHKDQHIDYLLLIITLLLACIGLVMVYSSSMYISIERAGTGTYYFKKQAIHVLIGLVVMAFLTRVNYKGFAHKGTAFLVIGYAFLIALLIQNHMRGLQVNRWLDLGRIVFQPSEIMKIILVIFLADEIARTGERVRDFKNGFLPLVGAILFTFVLVFMEPDLGVAGLLLMIGLCILFIGRAKLFHLLMIMVPVSVSLLFLVNNKPYMRERLDKFLNPEMGYQIKQSIISIGSGGLFGVGLGNSTQKYSFLPELHTDFVFSILAEELGFIGASLLLIFVLLYVLRGFKIARQSPDMFGFLIASGISMMIGVQVFINVGVATGLLPTTGMTLPFISYGGSSLITSFVATGILLNISKHGNFEMKLSLEYGTRRIRKVWA